MTTTYSRHISAAAAELADSAAQFSAGDRTLAGCCLANAVRDLAVCAAELTKGRPRVVMSKSLARQMRRLADELDPAERTAAE